MSDFFCGCDDGDRASVYKASDVRCARKAYRCSECGHAILPGESYERVYGIWPPIDGPEVIRTCARCMDLKLFVAAHVPCACLMHGYLIEGSEEAVEEYAHETVGLRFGYLRRKVEIERQPLLEQLREGGV